MQDVRIATALRFYVNSYNVSWRLDSMVSKRLSNTILESLFCNKIKTFVFVKERVIVAYNNSTNYLHKISESKIIDYFS